MKDFLTILSAFSKGKKGKDLTFDTAESTHKQSVAVISTYLHISI